MIIKFSNSEGRKQNRTTKNMRVNRIWTFCAVLTFLSATAISVSSCNGRDNGGSDGSGKGSGKGASTNVSYHTPTDYKLYIENSSSMDGFFNNEGGAKDARLTLYRLTQELKCSELFFINKIKIPAESDAEDVLKDMSLDEFKRYGNKGNRKESDLANLLQKVVNETPKDGKVSLVASDFIFSPSKSNASTDLGPDAQRSTITKIFEGKGLSVAILKTSAQFKGEFFTGHFEKVGKEWKESHCTISQKRPLYIWAIGGSNGIRELINNDKLSDFGVEKIAVLTPTGQTIKSRLETSKSRQYDIDRRDNHHAINAQVGGRGGALELKIWADLSAIALPANYKSDASNYETTNPNFIVTDVRADGEGICHINVKSSAIKSGDLTLNLKAQLPSWISDCSMPGGDWDIRENGNAQRTYGFKPLVDGVMDAMTARGGYNYTTITIKIN